MKNIDEVVFVGFAKQVFALDRYDGSIQWEWKAGHGSGFVSMMLDGDRLIVSCSGWTWCLDPLTGEEVWHQSFKGKGTGIPALVSVRAGSAGGAQAAQIAAQQAAAASAAAAGGGAAAAAGS